MIRVLIIDNNILMREGIKAVLSTAGDILVAGEIGEAESAVRKIVEQPMDVILLDFSVKGGAEFEVLKHIKRTRPAVPVLILSNHPEIEYGLRAIKSGAAGYLNKTCRPGDLIAAIRKLAVGGKYISTWLAEQLIDAFGAQQERAPHENLSNREFEILQLIASGQSTKEISQLLCLSISTVSTYRHRILKKMKMRCDAQLITYAIMRQISTL